MASLNFDRTKTRAQILALGEAQTAVNGCIYIGTDGGIFVGKADGSVIMSTQIPAGSVERSMLDEAVQTELSGKANKDGYYENLGAGYAKSMLGTGASVPAEFTRRTAGGTADIASGVATLKAIKGNTIIWNQLVKDTGGFAEQRVTLSGRNDTEYTVTNESTTTPTLFWNYSNYAGVTILPNHKYYIGVMMKSDDIQSVRLSMYVNFSTAAYSLTSQYNKYSRIEEAPANIGSGAYDQSICFRNFSDMGTLYFKHLKIVDITQMFGAGNEPASVAEFEALFPNSYYPYNAGQLLSLTAQKFVTDGFNAFNVATGKADVIGGLTPNAGQTGSYQITGAYTALSLDGETITPDTNGFFTPAKSGELSVTGGDDTTCVHLVWSGVRNGEYEPYWKQEKALDLTTITGKLNGQGDSIAIFPDGMRSAGTAHDELIRDASGNIVQAIKRIGSVDLGSLNWTNPYGIFYGDVAGINIAYGVNLLCVPYLAYNNRNFEKGIYFWDTFYGSNRLIIKDSAYTDAAAFKAAMSGVMLYYELTEPQTYVLDEPLDPNYRVDDYGAESIAPLTDAQGNPVTAPIIADVVYGPNVQDTIRRLPTMYLSIADYKTGIENIASALGTSLGKTIAVTWGGDNESVPTFTITDNPTE